MATTSTQRREDPKKSVPIKWRDDTWRPLILIRRVTGRMAAQSMLECEPRLFDWVPLPRVVAWSRAGRRLPGGARWVWTGAPAHLSRSRFPNGWRPNNSL